MAHKESPRVDLDTVTLFWDLAAFVFGVPWAPGKRAKKV